MTEVGIESINAYCGAACLDIRELFHARGLSMERFDNLLMERKSVGLPCEDPVTNGVNAAYPILDGLTEQERGRIELLIAATESGLDFGKAISTYILDVLGLGRNCRVFEIKQACYAGTAALQTAAAFIASGASPRAKALVVATDCASAVVRQTYVEPSQGTGAVAFLVSDQPHIMEIDKGAAGYYSYEVMDTCRPYPDQEKGDADLSLLSYLDCLQNSFNAYRQKVEGADSLDTFDFLAFHTPFGGMVKGAHRNLMRRQKQKTPEEIQIDFDKRLAPSMIYCTKVGNLYSASLYLALCSLIDHAPLTEFNRVGLFSYGSGCASEFFSGIVTPKSRSTLGPMNIGEAIEERYALSMEEYDALLDLNAQWRFGVQDKTVDISAFSKIYNHFFDGRHKLVLKRIHHYHREYLWS